jgi:hypothetical protein
MIVIAWIVTGIAWNVMYTDLEFRDATDSEVFYNIVLWPISIPHYFLRKLL